jgi:hypothetical protein
LSLIQTSSASPTQEMTIRSRLIRAAGPAAGSCERSGASPSIKQADRSSSPVQAEICFDAAQVGVVMVESSSAATTLCMEILDIIQSIIQNNILPVYQSSRISTCGLSDAATPKVGV